MISKENENTINLRLKEPADKLDATKVQINILMIIKIYNQTMLRLQKKIVLYVS